MSSDPIEVLRELAASWHRAALNCHECGKPSQARIFRECAAQVTSALASLSAPNPPPMNNNAVAVNESAPVNDKPESAEAVGEVLRSEDGVARVAMFNDSLRPGVKVYTAPPRPEASAPVGVEGLVKEMRMLAGVGIPVKPECVGRWADQLEALAQQPAAVDEAWPLDEWHEDNGPVVWWKFPVSEPAWIGTPLDSDWPGYHTHWTPHPTCPRDALAGQQHGGPQE